MLHSVATETQPRLALRGRSLGMGQFWHKMGCCVLTKPPPRRRRLELSMIGEPTNFTHLTHIGSGEMGEGLPPGSMQEQMRSKGPTLNDRNTPSISYSRDR